MSEGRGNAFGVIKGGLILLLAVGVGGYYLFQTVQRSNELAPFEAALPKYAALEIVTPEDDLDYQRVGKMLPVRIAGNSFCAIDEVYWDLPPEFLASKPDEVGTLVILGWTKRKAATYEDGGVGYRWTCSIRVVEASTGLLLAEESIDGPSPPETKETYGDVDGEKPVEGLARYYRGLKAK